MKTTLCLLSALGLLPLLTPMKAKAQPAKPALTEESLKYEIKRSGEIRYLLCLPKGYDAKGGKTWPLMLFLHGAGERGTNLQRVAIHGPPSLVKQGTNFPFILVAPQCPEGRRWENESLLQLLDHVMQKHAVDASRVYLTGLSMGGYGTWSLAADHPVAAICGGGSLISLLLARSYETNRLAELKKVGVWAFHGAKDPVVPLEESERMVNAFKKAGVKEVKLTVYPEADHNSWTETYNNPELYEWLLRHERKPSAASRR